MSINRGIVLIVENQQESFQLLTKLLSDNGYNTQTAKTGKEALASVNLLLPDLILLDIYLPDISGFEVIAQLKSKTLTSHIPVIFLSSHRESDDLLRAFEVGGVDYISKPYNSAEVLARVKTHVEMNHMSLELQLKNEITETQNEELVQLNEELIQTNETLFENQRIIKESKDRFEQLFKLNPDAVTITQISNGNIIDANETFYKLFRYSVEEVLGKTTLELNIWTDPSERQRFVSELTEKGSCSNFETTFCRKDRTNFSALVSSSIFYINGITHIIGVTRDITELKIAEEKIKSSEEKFRLLFENMSSGFQLNEVILNENSEPVDFRFLEGNSNMKNYFGFSIDEIRGKTMRQILPNADNAMIQKFGSVAITGKPFAIEYFSKTFNKYLSVNTYSPQKGQFASIYEDISERKKAEELLKAQESFLRTLTDNIPGMVGYWNKELVCHFANAAYLEWFGKSKEEMVGITMMQLMGETLFSKNKPFIEKALAGERSDFERTLIKANGEIGYTWAHYIPNIIEGEVLGFYVLVSDITELKKTEAALQESERALKESQMIAGLGTYVLDITTGLWTSSEILDAIFGIDPNYERSIENWANLAHPDWRSTMLTYFTDDVLGKRSRFDKEYKIVRISDGGERWVHGLGELELNQNGDPIRMVGTIMDITHRKLAEETLKQERTLLNSIMETSPVGIVTVDKTGRITYANTRGEEILQLKKDSITQLEYNAPEWKITDVDGSPFPDDQQPFVLVMTTLKPVYNVQHAIQTGNSERTILSINAAPIFDIEGKFNGMIASIEDITERKKAEFQIKQQNKELIELNATKDKFFSIIAHDLRGPLGNMRMFNQLIIENFNNFNKEEIRDKMSMFDVMTTQTYYLLENLLEWSMLQREQLVVRNEQCNIRKVVSEITSLFEEVANNKSIRLENNVDASIQALCDVNITKTILRNLIWNALKFVKNGGWVSITAVRKDSFIEIIIQDNGEGIAPDKIANLFNMAKNQSTLGTNKEKGTGLGLPLCKELAEKQGGQLWVESKEGEGSRFFIALSKKKKI